MPTSSTLIRATFGIILLLAAPGCGKKSGDECTLVSWPQFSTGKETPLDDTTNQFDSLAQTFSLTASSSTTATAVSVALMLDKLGTFNTGLLLTISISEDTGGSPSTTKLTTAALDLANVTSGSSLVTFTFPSPISLTTGKTYWLVLSAGYSQSNTNLVKWIGFDGQVNFDGGKGYQHLFGNLSTQWSTQPNGDQHDYVFYVNKC